MLFNPRMEAAWRLEEQTCRAIGSIAERTCDSCCARVAHYSNLHNWDVLQCCYYGSAVGLGFVAGLRWKQCTQRASDLLLNRSVRRLLRLRHDLLAPKGLSFSRTPSSQVDDVLLLRKPSFTIGYSQAWRSALWASYFVNAEMVSKASSTPRALAFSADKSVPLGARLNLSSYSGATFRAFDKGHLAPHAAIGYSRHASDASFNISNVALQHRHVNRIVWKALEHMTRRYVRHNSTHLCAVTVGVIHSPDAVPSMSSSSLAIVPAAFFMAVCDTNTKEAVGFIVANEKNVTKPKPLTLNELEAKLTQRVVEYATATKSNEPLRGSWLQRVRRLLTVSRDADEVRAVVLFAGVRGLRAKKWFWQRGVEPCATAPLLRLHIKVNEKEPFKAKMKVKPEGK